VDQARPVVALRHRIEATRAENPDDFHVPSKARMLVGRAFQGKKLFSTGSTTSEKKKRIEI